MTIDNDKHPAAQPLSTQLAGVRSTIYGSEGWGSSSSERAIEALGHRPDTQPLNLATPVWTHFGLTDLGYRAVEPFDASAQVTGVEVAVQARVVVMLPWLMISWSIVNVILSPPQVSGMPSSGLLASMDLSPAGSAGNPKPWSSGG
jgi:hypothetical protein